MNEFRKAVNLFNKYLKGSLSKKKSENITSQKQLNEKEKTQTETDVKDDTNIKDE